MAPEFVTITVDMRPFPGDRHEGRIVRSWRWTATIYWGGDVLYSVTAETFGRPYVVVEGDTNAFFAQVPDSIPHPPQGWLDSLAVLGAKTPALVLAG